MCKMKSSSATDLSRSLADGEPIVIDVKDGVRNQEHLRNRVRVAAFEFDDCVLDKEPPLTVQLGFECAASKFVTSAAAAGGILVVSGRE